MEWLNWKTILAFGVLVVPMAYCTMHEQRVFNEARVACIEQQGEWTRAWGGTCKFEEQNE